MMKLKFFYWNMHEDCSFFLLFLFFRELKRRIRVLREL